MFPVTLKRQERNACSSKKEKIMQQGPHGPFEGQQPPQQWQGQYPQQPQQFPSGQYPSQQFPSGQFPPQGQSFPQQYQQYGQPQSQFVPPPAPKKKSKKGLIIGIVALVVAVALCGIIGTAVSHGNSTPTTTGSSAQSASTGTWKTTHTYTGNGSKKTATFQVGSDWKIAWSCKGVDIAGTQADGALAISIFNSDGTPVDAASGTCKAGKTTSDATEEHQGGTVYLDIVGDSDWTIQVQELK